MKYVVIPNMTVQAAQALACNFVVNSAPIFASSMFAHALQRKTGLPVSRVAYNHLDAELLAENSAPFYFGAFQPQQRKGAVLINKKDYAGPGFVPSQSFQPTFSQHLRVTLVLETPLDDVPQEILLAIDAFLRHGKLAGGTITGHDALTVCETQEGVLARCLAGFWLVSRPDLLSHGEHMLTQFVTNATRKDMAWVMPVVVGYAAITPQAHRSNVRAVMAADDPTQIAAPLHAFAEPLVGLGQFVSVGEYDKQILPLWQQTTPRLDVWLVEQSQ